MSVSLGRPEAGCLTDIVAERFDAGVLSGERVGAGGYGPTAPRQGTAQVGARGLVPAVFGLSPLLPEPPPAHSGLPLLVAGASLPWAAVAWNEKHHRHARE